MEVGMDRQRALSSISVDGVLLLAFDMAYGIGHCVKVQQHCVNV